MIGGRTKYGYTFLGFQTNPQAAFIESMKELKSLTCLSTNSELEEDGEIRALFHGEHDTYSAKLVKGRWCIDGLPAKLIDCEKKARKDSKRKRNS